LHKFKSIIKTQTNNIMPKEQFDTKKIKRVSKISLKDTIDKLDIDETTFFLFSEYSTTTVASTASRIKDKAFKVSPIKKQGLTTVKRLS